MGHAIQFVFGSTVVFWIDGSNGTAYICVISKAH